MDRFLRACVLNIAERELPLQRAPICEDDAFVRRKDSWTTPRVRAGKEIEGPMKRSVTGFEFRRIRWTARI